MNPVIETLGLMLFRFVVLLLLFLGSLNVVSFCVAYFRPAARVVLDDEAEAPVPKGPPGSYSDFNPKDADPNRKLRVYVAASSREMPRVDAALAALDKIPNVEVTYRWIDMMRTDGGRTDKDLTEFEARVRAHGCYEGVRNADVLWLLYPIEPTRGAWAELGYASALHDYFGNIRVIVSHELDLAPGSPPGTSACIFTRKPLEWRDGDPAWYEYESDRLGAAAVFGIATARAQRALVGSL